MDRVTILYDLTAHVVNIVPETIGQDAGPIPIPTDVVVTSPSLALGITNSQELTAGVSIDLDNIVVKY